VSEPPLHVLLVSGSLRRESITRTVVLELARQCYAWALPYGVSFAEDTDVQGGRIVSAKLDRRLTMLARDVQVYGGLLARQRRADLAGREPGFLARLRQD